MNIQEDRFTLEEHIMSCWNVTEDIDLLFRNISEKEMTKDQIANCLLGMREIYNLKFDETFRLFEKLVYEKKIL
jgi:hypothetical protein